MADKCQTCNSPSPELHPAVQHEGEATLCHDAFHLTPTARNTKEYRERIGLEKSDGQ